MSKAEEDADRMAAMLAKGKEYDDLIFKQLCAIDVADKDKIAELRAKLAELRMGKQDFILQEARKDLALASPDKLANIPKWKAQTHNERKFKCTREICNNVVDLKAAAECFACRMCGAPYCSVNCFDVNNAMHQLGEHDYLPEDIANDIAGDGDDEEDEEEEEEADEPASRLK